MPQEVFPQILLRGHGEIRPPHPRPPLPRGAAGPRNRCLRGLRCAAVCCLGSRCPRQAAGRTQRNQGEKTLRKFWHLKSQSLGNFGHSKILPELEEHCGFEDVLMPLSWLKNHEKSVGYLVN